MNPHTVILWSGAVIIACIAVVAVVATGSAIYHWITD